jgi:hypothetical protein
VIVEMALDHFIAGSDDQVCFIAIQFAEIVVYERSGLLENAKGANHLTRHAIVADVEVV